AGQVDLRVEREDQVGDVTGSARDLAGAHARPVRDDVDDARASTGTGRVRDGERRTEDAAGARAVALAVGRGARRGRAAGGHVRIQGRGQVRVARGAGHDLAEGEPQIGDGAGEVDAGRLAGAEVEPGAVEVPAAEAAARALCVGRAGGA